MYSHVCFRLQILYQFYICYFCLHGPLRYFSHSVKCLALLPRIESNEIIQRQTLIGAEKLKHDGRFE